MKKVLILIMQIVDLFYPKKKFRVIVGSSNGRGIVGNSKIFGDYLEKNGYEVYYNWNNPPEGAKNICHNRIKDWPIFLSSKTVVTTHSISDLGKFQMILRRGRTFIELWHGIPLKAMGHLMDESTEYKRFIERGKLKRVKLWSVTSEVFKRLYQAMYPLDKEVFQVLGSPRNDQYKTQKVDFDHYLDDLPDFNKVILYAPTRRDNGENALFFPFKDDELEKVKSFIEKNRILILTRGHIDNLTDKRIESKYIRELGSDKVFDIDSILSGFDSVITDYSSIYFDYLFMNRPLAFIPYDIDSYLKNRGMLFDYDSVTPGHKILKGDDFIGYLEDLVIGRDIYKEKRQWVFDLSYKYQDFNSCERIFTYLTDKALIPRIC